jgi:hypothetical protein
MGQIVGAAMTPQHSAFVLPDAERRRPGGGQGTGLLEQFSINRGRFRDRSV